MAQLEKIEGEILSAPLNNNFEKLNAIIGAYSSGVVYKGPVETREDLPTNANIGDSYYITDEEMTVAYTDNESDPWQPTGNFLEIISGEEHEAGKLWDSETTNDKFDRVNEIMYDFDLDLTTLSTRIENVNTDTNARIDINDTAIEDITENQIPAKQNKVLYGTEEPTMEAEDGDLYILYEDSPLSI